MALVLDCSIVMALCFPDEASALADAALDAVTTGGAAVPAIWWFEVRNVLIVNERKGRIDAARSGAFLADLAKIPIRIDREPDNDAVLALARAHRLTVYDAAYLDLALRLGAPLATLGDDLANAAPKAGAALFTH
jgi:predicted nucleic acid-binding protein